MPKTPSNPVELGIAAPDFALPDAAGAVHRLADFAAAPLLLVAFVSNRCPFVLLVQDAFAAVARDYAASLAVVAINSNDAEAHPEETAARCGAVAAAHGDAYVYLRDEDGAVARAYRAACTPDLFLFGPDRRLAYHGQFDDARPGNGVAPTGADLRAAIDAALAGDLPPRQLPSIGCNIKWRAGAEPDWFRTPAAVA